MADEAVFRMDGAKAVALEPTSMQAERLRERDHLQEWILAGPRLLGPGVEIVASEFDKWQDARGELVHDRLDVLGIDPDGRLVVAELKRDRAERTVHTQALNYASMVSRLTRRMSRSSGPSATSARSTTRSPSSSPKSS